VIVFFVSNLTGVALSNKNPTVDKNSMVDQNPMADQNSMNHKNSMVDQNPMVDKTFDKSSMVEQLDLQKHCQQTIAEC
jgi:hypothetical protein